MSALASVLIFVPAGAENRLRTTVENLERIDPATELETFVVGDRSVPEAAPTTRARHLSTTGIEGLDEALRQSSASWVTHLLAGERLFPDWLRAVRDAADADLVYGDSVVLDPETLRGHRFFRRPGWSPELLLGHPYLRRGFAARRDLALQAGGFRPDFRGAEGYDLVLRLAEETAEIVHVPRPVHAELPPEASDALAVQAAVQDALRRRSIPAKVAPVPEGPTRTFRVRREAPHELVTIVVPTRDRVELLRACVESIRANTSLPHEIVVVDNDSRDPDTLGYLQSIPHRVLRHPGPFNYAEMNNRAAEHSRGRYLLFLSNDTVVHDPEWLPALLGDASEPGVGAVGARLVQPDGAVQHVGILLGSGARPDHPFSGSHEDPSGHPYFPHVTCEVVAVTAACMMIRRGLFLDLGGFDPALAVAYNDVDLCLRLRRCGYRILFNPFCTLTHHECATREPLPPLGDEVLFRARWSGTRLDDDPYLSPVCSAFGPRRAFPGGRHLRSELGDTPQTSAPTTDRTPKETRARRRGDGAGRDPSLPFSRLHCAHPLDSTRE